jgi:preprotein translocase subunit YajC
MKKAQLLSLGLTCLVFSIAIAVILCVPQLAEKYLPNLLQYMFPMMIILAIIGSMFYFADQKKRRMKNDPHYNKDSLHELSSMLRPLTIFSGVIIISNLFEKRDERSDPELLLTIILLTSLMWTINKILKHQQKRIDALEEKLKIQNHTKEQKDN